MPKFYVKTKGNAPYKGKNKIYFTCHPDDFKRYFSKICDDLFASSDVAIFYKSNLNEEFSDQDKPVTIGTMNLFVVPVTFRLLSTPNLAMDSEIAYAKKEGIPILPILMENGIEQYYSQPEKFGERQYLSVCSNDLTEVRYEEKLKKYLDKILINNALVERIKKAFDTQIFLSYRKKDRVLANELINLIHSDPAYNSVAIWYDEFLTPGESFKENIEETLKNSDLFTLLVTPSLLEDANGKPNFVMAEEYPKARELNMKIFPALMQETSASLLAEKFPSLPSLIDPYNEKQFKKELKKSLLQKQPTKEETAEKNFLLGLAYLEGIAVEFNKTKGVELIISSAKKGNIEAVERLLDMYTEGVGVSIDYDKALYWAKKFFEQSILLYGEEDEKTVFALTKLYTIYLKLGRYKEVTPLIQKCYSYLSKKYGEEDEKTISILADLALSYNILGDYQKALAVSNKCYSIANRFADTNPLLYGTVVLRLASFYVSIGKYELFAKFSKESSDVFGKTLGEGHPFTILSRSLLATAYYLNDDFDRAKYLAWNTYSQSVKHLGEEHPTTLTISSNLFQLLSFENENAFEIAKKIYDASVRVLGESHPSLTSILIFLAQINYEENKLEEALRFGLQAYKISKKLLGNNNQVILSTSSVLATIYYEMEDVEKGVKYDEITINALLSSHGEESETTLCIMLRLGTGYAELGKKSKALSILKRALEISLRTFGEGHEITQDIIDSIDDVEFYL